MATSTTHRAAERLQPASRATGQSTQPPCNSLSKPRMSDFSTPHTCIDVEEVVPAHARLAGNASRDDHQISSVQGC